MSFLLLMNPSQNFSYPLMEMILPLYFLTVVFGGPTRTLSAALNMPANLENSAMSTGLEKVRFHSNFKEGQCQRMYKKQHNTTHFPC